MHHHHWEETGGSSYTSSFHQSCCADTNCNPVSDTQCRIGSCTYVFSREANLLGGSEECAGSPESSAAGIGGVIVKGAISVDLAATSSVRIGGGKADWS
jgi:hypothetical protein